MEKTEMMKRFEEETDKQSAILKFMAGGQALEQKSYPKLGPYDYNMEYIAWLEAKANISDETIEKFQKIIRNQCYEISALKEKAESYDRLMSGGKKTLKEWANLFGMVVAVDKDGEAWAFAGVPVIDREIWRNNEAHYGQGAFEIPKKLVEFDGNWQDSLTLPDGWEGKQ